jgi:hypothetical protein
MTLLSAIPVSGSDRSVAGNLLNAEKSCRYQSYDLRQIQFGPSFFGLAESLSATTGPLVAGVPPSCNRCTDNDTLSVHWTNLDCTDYFGIRRLDARMTSCGDINSHFERS